MKRILEKIVDRYYAQAILEAKEASGNEDALCLAAISNRSETAQERLAKWIRLYKVHRVKWGPGTEDSGLDEDDLPTFADAVAKTALTVFGARKGPDPDIVESFGKLREEIGIIYTGRMKKERQFISLTSKVLWCFFPSSTPIYDQFSYRAVVFLSKIYSAMRDGGPYKGDGDSSNYGAKYEGNWEKASRATKDTWWYAEFTHSHRILFGLCREHIEYRIKEEDLPPHVDALRIFDKILWILGNEGLDYSLRNT